MNPSPAMRNKPVNSPIPSLRANGSARSPPRQCGTNTCFAASAPHDDRQPWMINAPSCPDPHPACRHAVGGPAFAQSRSQLGPLCTTDTTPADQQIDACNKIIALKVFSGEKLATIYFWRAVGWNKKGDYTQVIADASEAMRLKPRPRDLQSARLGLLRQGRIRHRHRGLQRRASGSGPPQRHRLSTTAAMPGVPRATMRAPSPTTTRRSRLSPKDGVSPTRTAASRNRRSAISTARSPTSTKRSGSIRAALAATSTAP